MAGWQQARPDKPDKLDKLDKQDKLDKRAKQVSRSRAIPPQEGEPLAFLGVPFKPLTASHHQRSLGPVSGPIDGNGVSGGPKINATGQGQAPKIKSSFPQRATVDQRAFPIRLLVIEYR